MNYVEKLKIYQNAPGRLFEPDEEQPFYLFSLAAKNAGSVITEIGDDYVEIVTNNTCIIIPSAIFVLFDDTDQNVRVVKYENRYQV